MGKCVRGVRRVVVACPMVCAAWLLASTVGLKAQSSSGSGTIEGSVVDPAGKAVADAAVVIRNETTGVVRAVVSDSSGRFAAAAMPVGTYAVQFTAPSQPAGQPPVVVPQSILQQQGEFHYAAAGESPRAEILVRDGPYPVESAERWTAPRRAKLRARGLDEIIRLNRNIEASEVIFGRDSAIVRQLKHARDLIALFVDEFPDEAKKAAS